MVATLVIFHLSSFKPPVSPSLTHPHCRHPLPAHALLPRHMTTSPLFIGRRF